MIFVTVGTHEQQFDRLVSKIDQCVKNKIIEEEVFIQRGYSTYIPQYCNSDVFIPNEKIANYYSESRIVVTHGGPCSIINTMQHGKIPIVVPRMVNFGEHVDNHQVFFTQFLEKKGKIIAIYDILKLPDVISNYEKKISYLVRGEDVSNILEANIKKFSKKLDTICSTLL